MMKLFVGANAIGWLATAVFTTSYFFRQQSVLRKVPIGSGLSVVSVWRGDRFGAGDCGECDCGGRRSDLVVRTSYGIGAKKRGLERFG